MHHNIEKILPQAVLSSSRNTKNNLSSLHVGVLLVVPESVWCSFKGFLKYSPCRFNFSTQWWQEHLYHLLKCLWFLNNWMLNKIEARLRLCKCTVICKNSVGILGSTHDDSWSSVFLSNLCPNPFLSDVAFCSRRNFCHVALCETGAI